MIDDDDIEDDEGVNPFSAGDRIPDPGPVTSYQTPPDPYANPAPTLTPEEFVDDLLRRKSKTRRGLALKPHISSYDGVQYGPPMLLQAEAIDLYLMNGHEQLTIEQMRFVLTALEESEPIAPLAGSTSDRAGWDRALKTRTADLTQQIWYADRNVTRGRR